MFDHENKSKLGKTAFDDNNQEKKSWYCLGQSRSRSLINFLPHFFIIMLNIFGWFGEYVFLKLLTKSGWIFCVVQQDTIYPPEDYGPCISTETRVSVSLVAPSRKVASYLKMAQNWKLSTEIW